MNTVVFITGVSSGFGKAIASSLSLKGFTVYGTSRKGDSDKSSKNYTMLRMDVKDSSSIHDAVSYILNKEGKIDILINNAGISIISPLEESPLSDVENIFDTNIKGVLRICQAVLPCMRQQKKGLIINISSIGGLMGLPFRGIYSASKFALEGLSESLSMEVKPFGVNVCIVEPGEFKTDIGLNRKTLTLDPSSAYKANYKKVLEAAEKEYENGDTPEKMGEFIYNIINSKNPKLRYKIGSPTETFSTFVKKILPGRMFEKIILKYSGM